MWFLTDEQLMIACSSNISPVVQMAYIASLETGGYPIGTFYFSWNWSTECDHQVSNAVQTCIMGMLESSLSPILLMNITILFYETLNIIDEKDITKLPVWLFPIGHRCTDDVTSTSGETSAIYTPSSAINPPWKPTTWTTTNTDFQIRLHFWMYTTIFIQMIRPVGLVILRLN